MEYGKLGRTGLEVSRLGLGGDTFGEPSRSGRSWTLSESESREVILHALDLGINFFDTANSYSDGSSEEILGATLKGARPREEVVIATKVWGRMRPGPNGAGLSRKAIMDEIDASLTRLRIDYVDLYQIHRWDPNTPVAETMEALHDVVKAGKARYIGASSMFAWQFASAIHVADLHGWSTFVSMQTHYNLLYREEEREMIPFCENEGIGVVCWSPLAGGLLARDLGVQTGRSDVDPFMKRRYSWHETDAQIIEAVGRLAAKRGVPRATIALAWLLSKPSIAAPILGVTKTQHLDDAIAALGQKLTPDEVACLEDPYRPREVAF